MKSSRQYIAEAERKADIAFTLADSRAKSIKHVVVHSESPLSTLIHALAVNGDVLKSVAEIEADLLRDVSSSVALLDAALVEAENLIKVADYLEGVIPVLELPDFNLLAQAKTVREAHLAGTLDAIAVASDIRRYLTEATAEVKRVKQKWGIATISASKVAAQSIRVKALTAIADPSVKYAEMKLVRLKAIHNWYHGGGEDNRLRRIKRQARKNK